jgi:hypothetical protein
MLSSDNKFKSLVQWKISSYVPSDAIDIEFTRTSLHETYIKEEVEKEEEKEEKEMVGGRAKREVSPPPMVTQLKEPMTRNGWCKE